MDGKGTKRTKSYRWQESLVHVIDWQKLLPKWCWSVSPPIWFLIWHQITNESKFFQMTKMNRIDVFFQWYNPVNIHFLPSFFLFTAFHLFSPPPLVVLCRVLFQLYINTAMCVNTLRYECTTFYVEHRCARRPKEEAQKTKTIGLRRDGRNESSRDTFPCHYNPSKPNSTDQFVTIRYILSTIYL